MLELFSLSYGQYADTFPVTLFTGKRAQSNAAQPEVVQSKGKRFMQVDEPEEGANINVGLMKNFTGGDKIKGRALFKDPIEFKPQFKIILVCNDLPKVPPYDGGVWRRLEVVEFISKFVENPEEENEFPRDEHLSEKLKDWKETFMSILLDYYKLYQKEGLKAPEEVTKYTKEFQKNCDIYFDFISRYMKPISDKNYVVNLEDLFREFKLWYTENNMGGKCICKREMITYLEKKYGKNNINNDFIKGFRLTNREGQKMSDLKPTKEEEKPDEVEEDKEESIPAIVINANSTSENYKEF